MNEKKARLEIRAMPYVPGQGRGILRRGRGIDRQGQVALIRQSEIAPFRHRPAAIILVDGAPLSHVTIAALGWGIPMVIIGSEQAAKLPEGAEVGVDGLAGLVTCGALPPAAETAVPGPAPGSPVLTADGDAVQLRASVRNVETAGLAARRGACGIGLVRTEFLQPADDRVPEVEFYTETLRALCRAASPLPVTLRLLDLAPDKRPPWFVAGEGGLEGARSPLGMQGARLFTSAQIRTVVASQLEAVCRLQGDHELRVLIPFLTRYEEMLHWRDWCRQRLPEDLAIGAMVETPAAALDLVHWLQQLDFVAVGCNDLMQSLFAADRDQPLLRHFLDPYAPLLYRFFAHLADAAGPRLGEVQLCGVLPQLPGVLPLLLGLGFRTFSVEANMVPHLARVVNETRLWEASRLAQKVCSVATSREVTDMLRLPSFVSWGFP